MNPYEVLPIFVFGTLRRGRENHHCLAGRYERCLVATLVDFRRAVARHGFPAVTPAIGDRVSGELFFLHPEQFLATLQECDLLEDLPVGELVGEYYQRAKVKIDTAEGAFTAWAYIDPRTPAPHLDE
ncbi:MAG: gamma-glutamylcyclotransferase [Planctomycetes bacterium]|nr:gamma-glutamylcyclotransferase [Planctomycetota bacterium]